MRSLASTGDLIPLREAADDLAPYTARRRAPSTTMLRRAWRRDKVLEIVQRGRALYMERVELERVTRELRCSVCGTLTLGKLHPGGKRYCQPHRGEPNRAKKGTPALKRTPKQRARMREAALARWQDPDQRDAVGEATRKRFQDAAERAAAGRRLKAALAAERDRARRLHAERKGYTLEDIAGELAKTVEHVRDYWVARGLLRAERPRGFHRLQIVPLQEYRRFKSDWVQTADGSRTRWWDEEVVVDCARRTGRVARLARETGCTKRQVEDDIRRAVRRARQRLKGSEGGRPRADGPSERDLRWAERFIEFRESRELMEIAGADRIRSDEGDETLQAERAEYEEIRSDSGIFRLMAQERPGASPKQIGVAVRRLLGALAHRSAEDLARALEHARGQHPAAAA